MSNPVFHLNAQEMHPNDHLKYRVTERLNIRDSETHRHTWKAQTISVPETQTDQLTETERLTPTHTHKNIEIHQHYSKTLRPHKQRWTQTHTHINTSYNYTSCSWFYEYGCCITFICSLSSRSCHSSNLLKQFFEKHELNSKSNAKSWENFDTERKCICVRGKCKKKWEDEKMD